MKFDRPGFALTIAFFVGGAALELGIEKAAALVFLLFMSVMLYRAFAARIR